MVSGGGKVWRFAHDLSFAASTVLEFLAMAPSMLVISPSNALTTASRLVRECRAAW